MPSVDGVAKSLTLGGDNNNTDAFNSTTIALMSRNCTSLFGAGRIAEVAIWGGIQFTQTDVNNLYNSGAGALATSVQAGSLAFYWQILGTASPEPATTGGVNMNVTGTTSVAHPFGAVSAPATHKARELRGPSRAR